MKQGRWIKERKPISDYPETEQQKKIKEAGNLIKEKCTGMEGPEFKLCRSEVLDSLFKKKGD